MKPDDDTEIVERESGLDLVPIDAEVSTQIATAKRYPRNVPAVRKRATEIATLDEETAAGCFYSLPRAGKPIVGPSVRLAEIVASSWGNIRYGARVLDHDDSNIRAQGMCWDLESNVACTIEVTRRITDKTGRRYNDDMVTVTGNAANSIALRNAILKVIPGAVWKAVYDQARHVAIGDALTLTTRRANAVEYFGKLGVDQPRVLARLGRANLEEVTLEDLEILMGLKTSLREGDTTVAQAFASSVQAVEPPSKSKGKEKPETSTATPAPTTAKLPDAATDAQTATPAGSDQATEKTSAATSESDGQQDLGGIMGAPETTKQPEPSDDDLPIHEDSLKRLIELAKQVNAKLNKRTAAVDVIEKATGRRNAAQLNRAQARAAEVALLEVIGETK